MITQKQYEKAMKIIAEYKSQQRSVLAGKMFDESDLMILEGAIAIPCLTDNIVDEGFASNLNDLLEESGYSIGYISLDDMGFIVVQYFAPRYFAQITDQHVSDLLSILNQMKIFRK